MILKRYRQRKSFAHGCALVQEARWSEAEAAFRRAIALDPDDSVACSNLAIVLLKQERWEEAATACQTSIGLDSAASEAHANLGIALLKLGRWEEAIAAYSRALDSTTDARSLHDKLGIAFSKLGRWGESAAAYGRAIELAPDQPELHRNLGAVHLEAGQWEEAASAFRKVLSLDPGDQEASELLGSALASLKSKDESAAVQHLQAKRWDQTADIYRRAIERDPQDHLSYARLGSALSQLQRWEEAADAYGRAAELTPDRPELLKNLGAVLLEAKQWEEAASALRKVLALDPGDRESPELLRRALAGLKSAEELTAVQHLQAKRWDETADVYRRAIERDPKDHLSYARLGSALSQLQHWEEAADAYRRAIELAPDQPDLHKNLGAVLLSLEQWEEAASVLRKSLSLDPADTETSALLSTALSEHKAPEPVPPQTAGAAPPVPSEIDEARARWRFISESVGTDFLKLDHKEDAVTLLQEGAALADACFQFLLVDPLLKLGRGLEAAAAHRKARGLGAHLPALPGSSARSRIEQRRASFWTPANLGAEVFRAERWLEQLLSAGPPRTADAEPAPRLLFVLDSDYGELTTLMYLLLGQDLINQTTLLLPERLYAKNAEALPGKTHRYDSLDDIVKVVDREEPDVVLLCSGYLFSIHQLLPLDDLESLVGLLRERACEVVTSDPFLGMLSKQDPRTLVAIDIPEVPDEGYRLQLREKKEYEDERLRTHFTRCVSIFANSYHLYPAYCGAPDSLTTETDALNISFFNSKLIYPTAESDPAEDGERKPHWLFILSQTDYDTQRMFVGFSGFLDIVAEKLVDALAAGRHPIFFGPKEIIEPLADRMPTTELVDILSFCSFNQFASLSLTAEHAFYWNVLSHSILIRHFNKLPVVVFDKGHLIRNVPAVYDRVIHWYYQGWEPTFWDHREPLTLEALSENARACQQEADRIGEGFRKAPTPAQMIDGITGS